MEGFVFGFALGVVVAAVYANIIHRRDEEIIRALSFEAHCLQASRDEEGRRAMQYYNRLVTAGLEPPPTPTGMGPC